MAGQLIGDDDPNAGSIDGSQTADANQKAKHKLHKKNRKGNQLKLILPLSLTIQSGLNYNLSGFGAQIDAKYIAVEVTHNIKGKGQASETEVQLQRCLGYPV